ncbi:MAG: cytochrome b/b6 domain-containing protein [Candidatus Binatia bacterium]
MAWGIAYQRSLCLGVFVTFILHGALLWAQPVAKEICLGCHSAPGLQKIRDGKTVSLQIEQASFDQSIHRAFECTTCHSDSSPVPHKSELKPVQCDTCHTASVNAYAASIHGKARAQGFTESPTCASCHGDIHKLVARSEPNSPINPGNIAKTCAVCHADAALVKKFRIPLVRPVEAYLQSAHARALAAGKGGAVCTNCHGAHTILPANDASSQIARPNVPETCGKCHADVLATFRQSIHGEAVARGMRDAPVCTDCHGEHRILARNEPNSPVFATNVAGETCGRCHGDTRMSERFGLPPDKVPAFQDSFHGLALRAGQLTAANCASCHGVHDIRPSSEPRSHVHKTNLPATCGKCHPGAGTRFALGPVHVSAMANSPLLFGIRIIYLWAIGLTIGFMIVHNALDLIHKSRHPSVNPPLATAGKLRERMSRSLRWQHGMIMATFPVLAYTGFALTYPESWWAAPLLHWEASFGLRGFIHRGAALILLGALGWHLAELGYNQERRIRLRKQMLGWQDLRDLWYTMRYNLDLESRRPSCGEFNYAEKFEYWAFLWGMIVMTITGFLLWFENISLTYLPKPATDIATTIHFYEAALATLSIFFWHLYWVIYDPEVYPMDAAWWHGRSPDARVRERMGGTEEEKSSEPTETQKTEIE